MTRILWMRCCAALLVAWAGLAHADALLHGSVSLQPPAPLPKQATMTVVLHDVSVPDEAPQVLGQTVVSPLGGPPIPFDIAYDPAQVRAGHRYTVAAQIVVGKRLLYFTEDRFGVFGPADAKEVSVEVVPVKARAAPSR